MINEKISTAILFFLLLIRSVDQYLPSWIWGANAPGWWAYWYAGIAYILTVVILWLNRHRLASLNIDRPFIVTLIIGGFLYLFYLTPNTGVFVAITAAVVLWAHQNNRLLLKNTVEYPSGTIVLILLSLLLALLPIILFNITIEKPISLQTIVASALQAQLALTVFDEVLFRGLLWAYLRHLSLKDPAIFLIQAFLSWIAHSKYIFLKNPYAFWVTIPLLSLLFGFMVWRSRSLTPSTIAHFLFNFTSVLVMKLF